MPTVPRDDGTVDVDALLAEMTLAEKAGQCAGTYVGDLDGVQTAADVEGMLSESHLGAVTPFGWAGTPHVQPADAARVTNRLQRHAVEETRLGIPLLVPVDAIHGNAYVDGATAFPHNLALAATFDPDLAERVGRVTAREARATGATTNYGPTCDVVRDPRWGRTFETFGESPTLVAAMAVAKARGLQGDSLADPETVAATAKHFPAYGGPLRGEDTAPVEAPGTTFHRTYLPPFEAAVDAGVGSVMPCYNSIDGVPAHGSESLLTELLRDDLGFDGVVASDWNGVDMLHDDHRTARTPENASVDALGAGVDVASVRGPAHAAALVEAVERGDLSESDLDRAVRRVLSLKADLGLFDDPYVDADAAPSMLGWEADRTFAREVARQATTLLVNGSEGRPDGDDADAADADAVLPLSSEADVLVTGPNADDLGAQLGGWSVLDPSDGVTVREGFEDASEGSVTYEPGTGHRDPVDVDAAASAAAAADAAVVVLGEGWYIHEFGPSELAEKAPGEFPARNRFELPEPQRDLLRAVAETGTPTVLVVVAGRPLPIPEVAAVADATLFVPFPGTEGGRAIADVCLGAEPGGRLPISIPRSAAHLPTHHDYVRHPHPIGADEHPPSYDPLFGFGHGLSYTAFEYDALSAVATGDETATVTVEVTNAGDRAGSEVVQAYVRDEYASRALPVRELCGFERVALDAGESRAVRFEVGRRELGVVDSAGERTVEPGAFTVTVGENEARFEL